MTTTHATRTTSGISAAPIGITTAVVASALTTLFAHDWGEVAFMVPVILVAAGLVFGLVVPRALRKASAGGTALGLSIRITEFDVDTAWHLGNVPQAVSHLALIEAAARIVAAERRDEPF